MREVVLDTETTGLDPLSGHRIVEIGCVELVNHVASGRTYHQYVNPERDMPAEAFRVHGLSEEFLSGHPVFADVADAFVDFVGDAPLVIHNASFDMGFINAELARLKRPSIPMAMRMTCRPYGGWSMEQWSERVPPTAETSRVETSSLARSPHPTVSRRALPFQWTSQSATQRLPSRQ